jgi:CheY-like chemotaxis protein
MLDPSPVEVDSGQINQVVQNLVINAIQAMPHGGTIHVSAENVIQRGTRFVRWTVGDQGVGIPADQLSRVFDPFFTTKRAGTGLGLAVSHSIIAKHGGWMAVESAVGAGTTFSVYLPAADVDPPEQELPSLIPPHAPVRVLVMDDEPMVHRALSRALGRGAHQAVCVETGEEAVLKYRQAVATGHRFDVVILDLTVRGGMGGRDTAREILHEDPEAKIVVASGYCDDPVMASYREFGFVASMAKPFSSEDVIRLIARISRR